MTLSMIALALLGVAPIIARQSSWRAIPIAGLIIALAILPGRNLVATISLASVLIVVCATLSLLSSAFKSFPVRFLPLIVYLVLLQTTFWDAGAVGWDRIGELLWGIAAWIAGAYAAKAMADDVRAVRTIALVLLGVVLLQAVVTALQTAGFDVFMSTGPNEELTAGRATGTLSHPGNLGKILIFVVLLALPITRSSDRIARRAATTAVLVSFVPIGLSESRANFIALVSMTLLWAVQLPRNSSKLTKFGLPLGVIGAGLAFAEPILQRFESDPEGGARNHLMDVAMSHIGDNLLLGVGPKMYVPYFGQFDVVTAQGWPVHNVFVLQTAELGLIGAVLLFGPLLVLPALRALGLRKAEGARGDVARAILSALPALLIVATTGWSLTSGDIALMFFFSFGLMATSLGQDRSQDTSTDLLTQQAKSVKV